MGKKLLNFLVWGILFLGLPALPGNGGENPEQLRREAVKLAVYLLPQQFEQLPPAAQDYLIANRYAIPQVGLGRAGRGPGNVIRGQFYQKGKTDWAALASRDGVSRILVFREGKGKPDELAARADWRSISRFRPDQPQRSLRFARELLAMGEKYLRHYHEVFGGPEPPEIIDHQGIGDTFLDGTTGNIWYFYRGKWRRYQGMD